MSDDDSLIDPRDPSGDRRHGETLLYDFSKFLTTLSLVALGGVLTLSEAAAPGELRPRDIGMVIAAITIGGVMALSSATGLVSARANGRAPNRFLRHYVHAATAFLGMGMGVFLKIWWDALQ